MGRTDRSEFPSNRVEREAAEWLLNLSEGLSREDRQRFSEWLGKSSAHRAAFARVKLTWRKMDELKHLLADGTDPARAANWYRTGWSRRRIVPIAAAVGALAFGFITWWVSYSSVHDAIYYTTVGQQQEIQLPDQSVISLNTDSEIVVRFSREDRRVQLTRGEAYFNVSPHAARPFLVFAGTGLIRAVGTAFNVELKDGDLVQVTVTGGVVEVAPMASSGIDKDQARVPVDAEPTVETLKIGDRLEYRKTVETISSVAPAELAEELAWQDGWISFGGATLAEIVDEVSRYTSIDITIEDPGIASRRFTIVCRTDNMDFLFWALDSADGINVRHISPTRVQIVPNSVPAGR